MCALRSAVKSPFLRETFPGKILWELQYSCWFPPALPDQLTNTLLFKLNLVSRKKVHEERALRLLCLILWETLRYPRHKQEGMSRNGKIRQKYLPIEITLDYYLCGMHHRQWVIGQSSWNLGYSYDFVFLWSNLVVLGALEKVRKFSAKIESSLILPIPQVKSLNVM